MNIEFEYFKKFVGLGFGMYCVGIKGKPFRQVIHSDSGIKELNVYKSNRPQDWVEHERKDIPETEIKELEYFLINNPNA